MTILPKKKKGEQESDSDSDSSSEPAQSPRPHVGASGHGGSPPPSEDTAYHHSPDGIYHRRYDLSSSSGDSSPEHPSISKRPSYRPPSAAAPSTRGKKPLDTSPYYSGYNSSEEYDGSRRPYLDLERERKFEQTLKTNRGFVIKKMRPDGACLFRAVADQVYGDQDMHSLVRNHSMDYMLKNADYFSQYVTEDFEQYINRKRADQCYGNNIEMQAVAEMYNRVIEVYEYSTEPSNIFFAVYKTDNAPIRLSYHGGVHYNSVVDPYKATVGVGLGLAGYKPGLADQNLLRKTQRESENFHIEKAMLEDKLRSTDWEATYEAIEEAVARESYLTWLREQEKQTGTSRQGLQSTSAACGGSIYPPLPPPVTTSTALPSTTSFPPPPLPHTTHTTTTTNSTSITITSMQLSNAALNFRSSPLYTTAAEVKAVRSYASSRTSSTATSLRGSRRGTPSPPASFTYRSSSGSGSVRNSPYNSPRDSPRGTHRGSPRNSPHNSAHTSPRNSTHGSPPPSLSLTFGNENDLRTGSHSPPAVTLSPSQLSPPVMRKSLLINNSEANNTVDAGRTSPHTHTTPPHLTMGSTSPTSQQLLSSVVALSPHHHHSPPPPPGSPPHHSLDFESGRVLGQLPYEYSSFLDLPPAALGLSEWEDDRVLAAALAASQQEYIDSLKKNARGAEAL